MLCGGIFDAIPTAIPSAPFTSKFGTLDGGEKVAAVARVADKGDDTDGDEGEESPGPEESIH
jgi:hypothetical protein